MAYLMEIWKPVVAVTDRGRAVSVCRAGRGKQGVLKPRHTAMTALMAVKRMILHQGMRGSGVAYYTVRAD